MINLVVPDTEDGVEGPWVRAGRATADRAAPVAVLDAGSLAHNVDQLVRRAGTKSIRVASKSVRSREVLSSVLALPGYAGVLAYTLAEAIWLVRTGVSTDVVVGYPSTDRGALSELATDPMLAEAITIMIDSPSQLDLVDAVTDNRNRELIKVCLELDCSLELGPVHLGAWRSSIRTPARARAAAAHLEARTGFRLAGVMGYEAQVAGVPNRGGGDPASTLRAVAVRGIQQLSVRDVAARRAAMVAAISEVTPLDFVNGGGTGSLETTAAEASVTEVAAGSGLFGPHLFDGYLAFTPRPAAGFALDVVRRPARGMVTVAGGGWIASGVPGRDRLPRPVWPEGLTLVGTEMAGEVQTPLRGRVADALAPGDRVWFRHSKAGELSEHVNEFMIIEGDAVVQQVATYRGEGQAFL
ncbi:alanine racemase [Propionibacteriaceae bacterium Y1700]|uniref:alanine racemase n=1 Tax=Microlunatus sp. Y1700 TaxID=3418487 RepID=UPI003DA78779